MESGTRLALHIGMRRWTVVGFTALAWLGVGCATTRMTSMGVLPGEERLVTLVVSEDRRVVQEHCREIHAAGPLLGCSLWRPTMLYGQPIRLITIVRYTDALPSPLALEIDVHELCHAVAALQPLDDPCHADNGGVVRAATDSDLFRR